jgi:Mce-associated membrane protein
MTTEEIQPEVLTVRRQVDEEPGEVRTARGRRTAWRLALLGVAAVVAVSGSIAWWQADRDEGLRAADTRDAVLLQTRQAISTMNTLDYREVDAGVKAWGAVTTGTLHDQLTQVSTEDRTLLAEQEKISTGRVVSASVVDLDDTSATVIAAVEVTVRDGAKPDAAPTVKRNRFTADAIKVGGRWKLETLQQVAVSVS